MTTVRPARAQGRDRACGFPPPPDLRRSVPRLGTAHRHSRIGPVRAAAWLIAALVSAGCGMPRDASGTLAHVRGGVIRVGLVANQPWVIDRGDTVAGIEGELVSTVARSVGARIEWVRMAEFDLIRALQRRELQIVIGGFDDGVSWGRTVALTRPYLESP